MKHCLKIWNTARLGFASLVRVHLALSVLVLFTHAGVSNTAATAADKTVKVEKTVEALHVDFSSKVQVPSAPEKFTLGFYLLPDCFRFIAFLSPRYSSFLQFPGAVATNPFYVFIRINAP
jgi:hypothetical protein